MALLISSTILVVLAATLTMFALASRHVRYLRDVPTQAGAGTVSIVVAARNESLHIQEAMCSLLEQRDVEFEVIAVNDRSTDRTGEILDRMGEASTRLRVVHVHELPAGWMGKNHALHKGAKEAQGDYLLFTDADVILSDRAVCRALTVARNEGLDHVAIAPEVTMPGLLLAAFTVTFSILFGVRYRPWKASDPGSSAYVGVGAFNFIRSASYRAIGGHSTISMSTVDDLDLGRRLKESGARQLLMVGSGQVSVQWYASLGELIEGLTKNAFAVVQYSLWAALATGLALATLLIAPLLGLFSSSAPVFWISAGSVACLVTLYAGAAVTQRIPLLSILFFPIATLLAIYILSRSALVTTWTGGITWRGTFYPLRELRGQRECGPD